MEEEKKWGEGWEEEEKEKKKMIERSKIDLFFTETLKTVRLGNKFLPGRQTPNGSSAEDFNLPRGKIP